MKMLVFAVQFSRGVCRPLGSTTAWPGVRVRTADQWPRPTADDARSTHKCVDGRDRPSRVAHVALPQSGIEDGTPPPRRPDLVELLERGQLASALTGSDRLRSTHTVDIGDGMYSLERRWSSRTFRYGYLVTTSPQSPTPPSAAPSP